MRRYDLFLKLRQVWPGLQLITRSSHGNVMLLDNEYDLPESADIEKIIWWRPWWKFWAVPPAAPETMDCDDYALLAYDIRQAYTKGVLPFGMAGGDRFGAIGVTGPHALNMLVCKDGPWLYDHRRGKYWKADPGSDDVYFVMM